VAVRDYAFNMLDIPILISIIHHQNEASKRVAKKVGMGLMKKRILKML
jgi:RimJ/RimL family protein N-acetyltransferase